MSRFGFTFNTEGEWHIEKAAVMLLDYPFVAVGYINGEFVAVY